MLTREGGRYQQYCAPVPTKSVRAHALAGGHRKCVRGAETRSHQTGCPSSLLRICSSFLQQQKKRTAKHLKKKTETVVVECASTRSNKKRQEKHRFRDPARAVPRGRRAKNGYSVLISFCYTPGLFSERNTDGGRGGPQIPALPRGDIGRPVLSSAPTPTP